MSQWILFLALLILTYVSFTMGRAAAVGHRASGQPLHSLPGYYGWYVVCWCGIPAFLLFAAWTALEDPILQLLLVPTLPADLRNLPPAELGLVLTDIRNVAAGMAAAEGQRPAVLAGAAHYRWLQTIATVALWVAVLCVGIGGLLAGRSRIRPDLRARNTVESVIRVALIIASTIAVITTVGIVLSLIFESMAFFAHVSPVDFLFGTQWAPMMAIREDQVGSSGHFGAVPLFTGTLLLAAIAMFVAVPVGLMTAVYMTEYAPRAVRAIGKPVLEILAGVPTVVYGFFAALTVAPAVRALGETLGLQVAAQSALAAGLVMGIMIIPFVSSLSDDVINAVPQSLRDGSYGLGATKAETTVRVLLPAALPGIVASVILAFSKALGETMIVVMAAGLAANTTLNPFEAVTTVTVYIAALLTGEAEFDSPKTLASFALGLVLFIVTLALNIVALRIVKAYREQYE